MVPGVTSDVISAVVLYVPLLRDEASYVMDWVPPAAGAAVLTAPFGAVGGRRGEVDSARAGPVLGTPVDAGVGITGAGVAEARSVGGEGRIGAIRDRDCLAGRPRGGALLDLEPDLERMCRGVPEVLDAAPVDDDPARVGATTEGSHPDRPGSGRVQVGPQRRDDIVRAVDVREMLRGEDDVGTLTAADDDVAVRDDADPRVRLTAVVERRHIEVRDRVVADTGDRPDPKERQVQVAAVRPDGRGDRGRRPAGPPETASRSNGSPPSPRTCRPDPRRSRSRGYCCWE